MSSSLQIAKYELQCDRDVTRAGRQARLLGSLAGARPRRGSLFAKAVRHVAHEALHSAAHAELTLGITSRHAPTLVEAVIRFRSGTSADGRAAADTAAGVEHTGVFSAAKAWVDGFSVEHDPRNVTTVRLRIEVPSVEDGLRTALAQQWSTMLDAGSVPQALLASQRRVVELAKQLHQAQQSRLAVEAELRQARSLNETLELLALVASKTDNAVIIMDASGIVEWVNDGFVRITGNMPSDVRGRSIVDILHGPLTSGEETRLMQQGLLAGEGISQEIENQRKDGQPYWASVSITPVVNDQGVTTRWIGIAHDVTRRRQAQEELRKAKESAEEANRAKSEFLANISHEIRTPMNAVIGMTDLALETALTDEQREYLVTAKDSAESLLRLLNDVLDLAKIEARRLELEDVAFRPRDVVHDAFKPLAAQARKKGLTCTESVEPDVPAVVVGDPARLRQILINLLDNAIKFTDAGEVQLSVRLQWQASDAVGLQFTVQDTGIGIPADKRRAVFEAFTQADSTTTRRYGGTGLGLTISGELVKMMGGRIWVESHVGQGSAFHVSLLFTTSPATALPVRAQEEEAARQTTPSSCRLSVLIADDNQANRTLAARVLEKRGHHIVQVRTGREAVAALERERFDVVLMDVQMPDMDGFESTAVIRQREKVTGGHLSVIAMTAYAMKGDRDRCLQAGMDAYLAKPVRAPELRWLVECLGCSGSDEAKVRPLEADALVEGEFRAALQRLEGDIEMFKEQIEFFLEDSPKLVEEVHAAIAADDSQRLQVAAHRLKGLAAAFDDAAIVASADALEQMGQRCDLDLAEAACQTLEKHLFRLQRALWHFLRNVAT